MAANPLSRRWIVLLLVAIGAILVATLPRGATDDEATDTDATSESSEAPAAASDDGISGKVGRGLASKRTIDGCDPVIEAKKYEELVDRKALAVLRWNGMSERAAKLRIPVYVKSADDGKLNVSILEIPMRGQYLTIWQNSGHLSPASDGSFFLDPCASWIEAWEEMEQTAPGGSD